MERIAVYAGSFDPFTKGHEDVIRQALTLFDRVFVVFAVNAAKRRRYDLNNMMLSVKKLLQADFDNRATVVKTDKLIVDKVKELETCDLGQFFMIRGLRDAQDFLYEENIARINRELCPEVETIYLRSRNPVVSSSMVNELFIRGKDVSSYVSPSILEVMKGEICPI